MKYREKGEQMKKNKEVEVNIEEQGDTHILKVGKKIVGTVTKLPSNKYTVVIDGEQDQTVKGYHEGYELLIRHWNLFQ